MISNVGSSRSLPWMVRNQKNHHPEGKQSKDIMDSGKVADDGQDPSDMDDNGIKTTAVQNSNPLNPTQGQTAGPYGDPLKKIDLKA